MPHGTPARPIRAFAALGAAAFAAILALSGCQVALPGTGAPGRTAPEENFREPEVAPELVPGGTAEQNLPYFTEVLRQFAVGSQAVEGQPIVDAITASGFDRGAMQVSFDRSKTNLVADSILVSVLLGTDCLIGQVQTADRSFVTTVQPALTEARNVCLVGQTRPIDW